MPPPTLNSKEPLMSIAPQKESSYNSLKTKGVFRGVDP